MSFEGSMDKEQTKEQKKGDFKWNFFLLGLIIPGLFCGI